MAAGPRPGRSLGGSDLRNARAVVDVAPLLDETPDRPIETFLRHTLVALLVLFPYLLYRFDGLPAARAGRAAARADDDDPARLDVRAAGDPSGRRAALDRLRRLRPRVPVPLDGALRRRRGAPVPAARRCSCARRRLQVLAGASAAITAALLLAAGAPNEDSAIALASTLLATVSAFGFLVGLAPPPCCSPGGGRRTHVCRLRSRA